jgi:hypothetical protein
MSHKDEDIDYGEINNTFYRSHFIQRKDALTERFKKVVNDKYYIENLPASFIDGLPNLEERIKIPLKTIPLYSKLIKGDYEKNTKYDKTTVKVNIQFFVKNLPSFKKYAKRDTLDWVILQHRLLVIEILEFYKGKNRRLSTLENRFNAILRVMKIAYHNKLSPVYRLFSIMVFQLHDIIMDDEGRNELTQLEEKKYINWKDVLKIQASMETEFNNIVDKNTKEAYDLNNDLLLISLYSLIPPLRNEIKLLEFTRNMTAKDKDYIYINKKMDDIVLEFNKEKKRHGKIYFDLAKGKYKNVHLMKIIKESYVIYPRKYLFTIKNNYPDVGSKATVRALDERLLSIFYKYGIENQITVNSLRSSYVTYRLVEKSLNYNDKIKISVQMRTSLLCLERSYNKVLNRSPIFKDDDEDDTDDDEFDYDDFYEDDDEEDEDNDEVMDYISDSELDDLNQDIIDNNGPAKGPVNKNRIQANPSAPVQLNAYEKKLQRDRRYYARNKEERKKKLKEYKDKKSTFEKTRERILQLLNASSDYAEKMRDSTKQKYKFVYDDVKKKWKWED